MDTLAFLHHLQGQPDYAGQMVHVEHIPPRRARYAELERPLPPALYQCLRARDLLPLYTHQAEAINQVRRGENVIVATSSASGKTLCYNLPVAETLLSGKNYRALYLFPTKALAQDQWRALYQLFCPGYFSREEMATFDGDTPREDRAEIRRQARLILTNPDMLHLGILPNHQFWASLLRNLKYVVVDEAHTYRGVFGTHVSGVLRRLRRLCEFYGSSPQFICSSATIANPQEHAERLTGLPFTVIESDGSPRGGKEFVFWNPPLVGKDKSTRRSTNSEATSIFTELVDREIRSLAFTRTRRLTELIYLYARRQLTDMGRRHADRIRPYRAGYLPGDRRRIEKEFFQGELLGVVATSALELGIDIGDLDATVLAGYPGSVSSTWQQAGRSGRSQGASLSFLVALNNPLDQYFMRHPESFFRSNFEHALVNPGNAYILRAHLLCAAWECPLTEGDARIFGPDYTRERTFLEQQKALREHHRRWYLAPAISYPAQSVNIRSTTGHYYSVVDTATDSLLETVEADVAFFQVYPGAVYLHQGESFLITRLDLTGHTAFAEPTDVTYYTQTKELTDLHINRVIRKKSAGRVNVCLGEVTVTTAVVGFKKKAQFTDEVVGEEPLDLPSYSFPTVALWFDLPSGVPDRLAESELDFAGGLHAVEHAAIAILPLFALCDRNDIGGVSMTLHPDTGRAQVFIYDAHPGGIGIAEKGFDLLEELWQTTLRAIRECPCREGCPSCIHSPKCGNNNQPLDKQAACLTLEALLEKG